jgi:hypothetical protein
LIFLNIRQGGTALLRTLPSWQENELELKPQLVKRNGDIQIETMARNATVRILNTSTSNLNETITFEAVNATPECRLLITQARLDAHYEILESVALRYPLPWDNDPDCRDAGKDVTNPIIVDMIIFFKHHISHENSSEAFGYSLYFDSHLHNTTHRRHVDARYVRYRSFSFVGTWTDFHRRIATGGYSYAVEATCDVNFKANYRRMRKSARNYCVLHGTDGSTPHVLKYRTCHLNPQHAPNCWFLPLDFPKFPPPLNDTNAGISVCTPGSKNVTALLDAIQILEPRNATVVVYGRKVQVPDGYPNLSITAHAGEKHFYDFQRFMASCHIFVPMLEPTGHMAIYFSGSKKLSGSVAQILGNRIPSVLHTSVLDIYRKEMTAPYFEYSNNNTNGHDSFEVALGKALNLYKGSKIAVHV